jgi:hypothetical protein
VTGVWILTVPRICGSPEFLLQHKWSICHRALRKTMRPCKSKVRADVNCGASVGMTIPRCEQCMWANGPTLSLALLRISGLIPLGYIREHKIVLRGPLLIFKNFHQKIVTMKKSDLSSRHNFHYEFFQFCNWKCTPISEIQFKSHESYVSTIVTLTFQCLL